MCEEIGKYEKIGELEAKRLLSRIAKFIGLEFVEMPKDAWYERHWCFSKGFARFSKICFSLDEMLETVLKSKEFTVCPGTWDARVQTKICYQNTFYGMSLEEALVKLDFEEQ